MGALDVVASLSLAAGVFVMGMGAGALCMLDPPVHHILLPAEAEAISTRMTGKLMKCFGDLGAFQCRPYGRSQEENPDLFIHPITSCYDGLCWLVTP